MIDSSTAPPPARGTDVHVPEPPPPDLSLPAGAVACARSGGTLTASDAKAVRDFAAYLERQKGTPPPTAAEPLPDACTNGTCACPSAPDGADQHSGSPLDRCGICGAEGDHDGVAHSDATGDGMGRYGPRLPHGGFPGRPEPLPFAGTRPPNGFASYDAAGRDILRDPPRCRCAQIARLGRCMYGCTGTAVGTGTDLVRGVWQSLCARCGDMGCEPA